MFSLIPILLGLLTNHAFSKILLEREPANASHIVDVQQYNNEINWRIIKNHRNSIKGKALASTNRDDSNYALLELFAFRAILCSKFVQSKIHTARDLFDNYICRPILKNKLKRLSELKDKIKAILKRKIANVQKEFHNKVERDVRRKRIQKISRTVETEQRHEHEVTERDDPSIDWDPEERPNNLLDGMNRHSHWDPYDPDKFR